MSGLFFVFLTIMMACASDGGGYVPNPKIFTGGDAIKTVLPKCPDNSLKEKREGYVAVMVEIDKRGIPVKAVVTKSDDSAFSKAVENVIMKWRFEPLTEEGKVLDQARLFVRFTFSHDAKGSHISYNAR